MYCSNNVDDFFFFKIYVHALTPTCAYLPEVLRKTGVTAEERAGENSAKHSQVTKRFKRDAGKHLADGRGQNEVKSSMKTCFTYINMKY